MPFTFGEEVSTRARSPPARDPRRRSAGVAGVAVGSWCVCRTDPAFCGTPVRQMIISDGWAVTRRLGCQRTWIGAPAAPKLRGGRPARPDPCRDAAATSDPVRAVHRTCLPLGGPVGNERISYTAPRHGHPPGRRRPAPPARAPVTTRVTRPSGVRRPPRRFPTREQPCLPMLAAGFWSVIRWKPCHPRDLWPLRMGRSDWSAHTDGGRR